MLDSALFQELGAYLRREGVVLAYLFGSVARQDDGPLSDVDIAILFGRDMSPDEAFDAACRLSAELPSLLECPTDVVILNTAPPLLRYVVIDEGVPIINEDDSLRVEFEARTINEYLDTQHLRAVQRHYLYERLGRGCYATTTRSD